MTRIMFVCHGTTFTYENEFGYLLGKSGHLVTMSLVSYYDFTTFQPMKI